MIIPRIIRQRDAPHYLGMDRNRFNAEVRPQLTEIPIGIRGIAFDRQELDAWADAYIAERGREPQKKRILTTLSANPRRGKEREAARPSGDAPELNGAAKDARATLSRGQRLSLYQRAMLSCAGLAEKDVR